MKRRDVFSIFKSASDRERISRASENDLLNFTLVITNTKAAQDFLSPFLNADAGEKVSFLFDEFACLAARKSTLREILIANQDSKIITGIDIPPGIGPAIVPLDNSAQPDSPDNEESINRRHRCCP